MKGCGVERERPGVDVMRAEEPGGATSKSNAALSQLPGEVAFQHSCVAGDKYLANDEDAIRKYVEISGFPATAITEVRTIIDPTTGQ